MPDVLFPFLTNFTLDIPDISHVTTHIHGFMQIFLILGKYTLQCMISGSMCSAGFHTN